MRFLWGDTGRSQDTCLLAVPRTKTVFDSRAFRVAAPTVFNSLPQDIGRLTIFLHFVAFKRRFISAMALINTSDITRTSDSAYFVDNGRVTK